MMHKFQTGEILKKKKKKSKKNRMNIFSSTPKKYKAKKKKNEPEKKRSGANRGDSVRQCNTSRWTKRRLPAKRSRDTVKT